MSDPIEVTMTLVEAEPRESGERQFWLQWPTGYHVFTCSETTLRERGVTIPSPVVAPDGCDMLRDEDGTPWELLDNGQWEASDRASLTLSEVIERYGDVTFYAPVGASDQ